MSLLEKTGDVFGEGRSGRLLNPFDSSLKIPRLHTLLPYESFDPQSKLFYNRGSTGFILGGFPLVGASLRDQEQIADFFRQDVYLPSGTAVQFLLFASPRISPILDYWSSYREGRMFQKLAQRRTDFLSQKAFDDPLGHVVRDFKLVISYTIPGIHKTTVDVTQIQEARRALKGAFENMGLPLFVYEAQDLLDALSDLLNFSATTIPERPVWNPYESLSTQLIDSTQSWEVEPEHVSVRSGEWFLQSWVPKTSPKLWGLPYMDKFLGDCLDPTHSLPCPYLLHYSLFVESFQDMRKSKMIAQRGSLEKSLKNQLTQWVGGLEEQYEETRDAVFQMQKGERSILTSFSLTSFCTLEKKPEMDMSLKRVWNHAGWRITPALYDHLGLFLSSFPMMGVAGLRREWKTMKMRLHPYGSIVDLSLLGKAKRTLTREAQNMLPILGEWKGQKSPGLLLTGRRGQLFFWSPFGKVLVPSDDMQTNHNYNLCIAGTMGSGKSVLMNELMTTVLGVGGRVIVLDKGRSFKNACLLLGGQHIEFSLAHPSSLNPFTHIPEGNSEIDLDDRTDMLGLINPIVQMMASPLIGTTDAQDNHIAKAIQAVWEQKKSQACLNDVAEYLSTHHDAEAKSVGHLLYQFTKSGHYGRFFNDPANVQLSHRLVVIETDDLRNHPKLLPVIVQMLIIQVNQMIAKTDRSRPFMILIDEAWELLKGKKTGDFISASARTLRKYKGSLVLATQSTKDYFREECPGATIAWETSAWRAILSQSADAIHGMKTIRELSSFVKDDYSESLLSSIRPHPPHFSEVALFGEGLQGVVGRLRLDPFSRLLYSSNPEEYRLIQEGIQRGFSVEDVIEEILSKGHQK
jgi:conjugal transfer ATP-binding protein TraC